MNQIKAKQFNGQELLDGMQWDMCGTWIENKEGGCTYVYPGDWLIGTPGNYTEVLNNDEFLERFSVETIIKPKNKSTMSEQKEQAYSEQAYAEARQGTELSFGEKAVGLTFNPSNIDDVYMVKRQYANLIDILDNLRAKTDNPEKKRQLSVAITEAQTSQMWAVKAITWQY